MKKKHFLLIAVLGCCFLAVAVLFLIRSNRHARIDEWSSMLTAEKFSWAQVSKGYGIDQIGYSLADDDFEILAELLHEVTEDNCMRKYPKGAQRTDCRLAFEYDGKLWLFHCLSNGMLRITFEDAATAEYYGCYDSMLCTTSQNLYHYILDTVNTKAE